MTALATSDQVRAIQAARKRAGLDDVAYRAALSGFEVVSTKELTAEQASAFLNRLNRGGTARHVARRATGPYGKKLQALWIAGWNLGVVRNRDDAALLDFVERQTGLSHTRFLHSAMDAARAIEAIKAMLAREGGVAWPAKPGPGAIAAKRAVVAAQIKRMTRLGLVAERDHHLAAAGHGQSDLSGAELDGLSRRLGTALRRSLSSSP